VVAAEASCAQGGHRTADLRQERVRDQLTIGRWDRSLDMVERWAAVGRYGFAAGLALGATALVVLALWTSTLVVTLAALLGAAALAPAAALMAWPGLSVRSFRDGEQRLLGAVAPPPLLLDGEMTLGQVIAGRASPAPLSGRPCVAYSVALHHRSARPSTLIAQEATSGGFRVRTDDGRAIDVPDGTIVIAGTGDVVDCEPERVRHYLSRLGLVGTRGERLIEFDEAREVRVGIGDQVAIFGALRADIDSSGEVGYRDRPTRLVPGGLPMLERLGRNRRGER